MTNLEMQVLERLEELDVDIKFPAIQWYAFLWGYATLVVVDKPYKKTYITPNTIEGNIIIPPPV